MEKNSNILITGSNGMVGRKLIKKLKEYGYCNLLTPNSKELDLRIQNSVKEYFEKNKIDYVIHLAAKVGGIKGNMDYPVEFTYDNIMINTNVIKYSYDFGIKKLLNLGSSCIYPRITKQPIKEEYLLDGKLELTNEGYALSKILGIKLCKFYNEEYNTNFISLMPCNLYGEYDHFEKETSHVVPALISRIYKSKLENKDKVIVWGSGTPKREFLYVDDLVDAIIYFMNNYDYKDIGEHINIGSGFDISINEFAEKIKKIIGYNGILENDLSKPDGTPLKLLDISKAKKLGWEPKTNLDDGLKKTIEWYISELKNEK